jgi:hypothetical protein
MLYRAGPVNIYVRIKTRFGLRLSEWMIAVQTLLFGIILLLPYDTFDASPVYSYARHIVSENVLGGVMVFFGVLRLVGLFVNGARQDVTPWIRVASAGVGFTVYTFLAWSFLLSGIPSGWLAFCVPIAVVEVVNVYRAAHDAGEYHASLA